DAVVIAAPNHWHSLMTVWACQAGKDVYVEKPISHNIWEGRKSVEAARKYNRIVQAGTQNRSDTGLREAIKYIKAGNLGKIQWIHCVWFKQRKGIGKVAGPQKVPAEIDYNLWTGPAPLEPLMRKSLHYNWHWFWSTGNGEMGNLGAHIADDARNILGVKGLPKSAMYIGGRFDFDDNAETPNTSFAMFDYDAAPVIVELRNLPMKKGMKGSDNYRGTKMGNIVQCTNGYASIGRGGGWVYDNNGKKIKQFPGDGGAGHQANFIEAMRSRKSSDLNADILEGHISAVMCHAANLSYMLGNKSGLGPIKEALQGNKHQAETFERFKAHLAANEIDLEKDSAVLGAMLEIDPEKEKFVGGFPSEWANLMSRRAYREPFVIPEIV
ncbi:MAG: Gfo/Idh/MocA family protein, partial [Planctomycetota bacterium]